MKIEIEEGQRQAIILALAKLSLSRPGWHPECLRPIAKLLGGEDIYEVFRAHGPDPMPTQYLEAALSMDWQQVVLNGGPPCFHLCEDGRFCGRAERWHGKDTHKFVSLAALLNAPGASER